MEKVVLTCESPWADAGRMRLRPSVRQLQAAGFTVMNMYPDGLCRLYAPISGETWPAECHAEVEAAHAAGIKVLAGVYPFVGSRGPRDLLTAHPEWRARTDDQTPAAPGEGCLLSPFGDALIDLLASRLKEYRVDGFQFDGWYQLGYCRCPSCRQKYKADTGREVPPTANMADLNYRRYLLWRDRRLFERFVQLRKAVKAVNPEAVLVNWNNNDAVAHVPSWMPESLDCVNDWTNKEWWDSNDVSSLWLIKRLRGAAGDRPAGIQPYMFMRHGYDVASGVGHGSSCPPQELLFRMHKVLAMGSIPIIWPGARQGWNEHDARQVTQGLVDFLPLVHGTRTLKYAALLDSYTSNQMRNDPDLLAHRAGITRALIESHIPFDVISEHNATAATIADYRVVVLPNVACISDGLVKTLRNFVMAGGGLIATYETSLYDEWGEPRPDFALADLFGTSFVSSASQAGPSRIGFGTSAGPVTDDTDLRGLMGSLGNTTYWGKFVRVRSPAQQSPPLSPLTGVEVQNKPSAGPAEWTPLLLSEHGHGRVAYFPAAFDAAYYDAGYPYERIVLANATIWAGRGRPTVRVTAPMCVEAGFFTKSAGGSHQTIVHLLNDIDSTTGHGSRNEKQFAIREEVIPIMGSRVTFAGERPARVKLVPGNNPLEIRPAEDGWEVTVPQLDLHAAVVADYKP